jgi:TIR domain
MLLESKEFLLGTSIFLSLALLITLSFCIYFWKTKRFSLRYQLARYMLKSKSVSMPGQFCYHGFVSYSSCDEKWVMNQLVSRLEGNHEKDEIPFKLCIHERDFKVGLPIAENIVLSLQQSATCILVLTEEFTKSYWCNFEAHSAHQIFQEQNRINNLVRSSFYSFFICNM